MLEPKGPGNLKLRLHSWAVMDLNPVELQSRGVLKVVTGNRVWGVPSHGSAEKRTEWALKDRRILKSAGITHTPQGGGVHWVSNWVLLTLLCLTAALH